MSQGEAGAAIVLTPWAILTATAGLVAFHMGLYTLIGRERKSPYVINRAFPIFLMSLVVATCAVASTLAPAAYRDWALWIATVVLTIAFLYSFLVVWRVWIRFSFFVDSLNPKHLPIVRGIRRWHAIRGPRPTYEYNPVPLPDELKSEITSILSGFATGTFETREEFDTQSLALVVEHQGQGNRLLAELAHCFLKRNFSVQYLTASRHPIEFVGFLKRHLENQKLEWQHCARHIVVIDAYSPHFAFTDSIYPKKDRELESLGVSCVPSHMTFAGMHSASSKAFNVIKERDAEQTRSPTLVIYEDTYALSDLESAERSRIFVRHVMPSERMWGGMFTVFLESTQPDSDWRVLQSYASMRLDLRSERTIVPKQTDRQLG